MLKQRILAAIVLISLLVAALFWLPLPAIIILFGIVISLAAWEWTALSGLRNVASRLGYVIVLLTLGILIQQAASHRSDFVLSVFIAATLWWLWALIELITRNSLAKGMFIGMSGRLTGGLLTLVPLWFASIFLLAADEEQPRLLLYLLVLVWVADTAAFIFGRITGKTKLAPLISPGKTVEGVIGGVLSVVLLAWLCGTILWKYEGMALIGWIGLAVVTALFSVVGDLTESKLKRVAGVKDSGTLIPGHGGVLDRIDALTAAAPVFALGVVVLMKN